MLAIGIGVIVGWGVSYFGKGLGHIYGFIGGGFSLIGIILGNIVSIALMVSTFEDIVLPYALFLVLTKPGITFQVLASNFGFYDLLFYGLAIYFGYRSSFR